MAVFGVWRNGYLQVNGVDLSDHVREMSLDTSCAELPAHVHGDSTVKVAAGLEDFTVNVTFLQDFAASKVDATLKSGSLGNVGHSAVNIVIGPDAGNTVSTTNPRYSGQVILAQYKPFGGQHGVLMEASATFRCGGATLTRQTAP